MVRKYATLEEVLAANKVANKKSREKHLEERKAKDREKYRLKHPDHKIYEKNKKTKPVIPKIQCQHIGLRTGINHQCTRKVTSPETVCWQHKNK